MVHGFREFREFRAYRASALRLLQERVRRTSELLELFSQAWQGLGFRYATKLPGIACRAQVGKVKGS